MSSNGKTYARGAYTIATSAMALMLGSVLGCYQPTGLLPERSGDGVDPDLTPTMIDAVVESSFESIYRPITSSVGAVPNECQSIHFIRTKVKGASNDSADANAVLFMVPGVLEGANAFRTMARNIVYVAKMDFGRNFEVWAMDRRPNCLEDLRGVNAAEASGSITDAENIMLDYYQKGVAINGETFEGFYDGHDPKLRWLSDVGMKVTTEDMHAIATTMMPKREDRQKKLFIGGHSLGGVHTSTYIAWDFDGDPNTLDDAGYNNFNAAFGFDTWIGPVSEVPRFIGDFIPFGLEGWAVDVSSKVTEKLYNVVVDGLHDDNTTIVEISDLFEPEVILLTDALGLLSTLAPKAESNVLRRYNFSPALRSFTNIAHAKNVSELFNRPYFEDFRMTNEAVVGFIFDDDFAFLSIIRGSLGFLGGGEIDKRDSPVRFAEWVPGLDLFFPDSLVGQQLYTMGNAGPDSDHFGQGPLYTWVNFDEIEEPLSDEYTDRYGLETFTTKRDEVSDMQEFSLALHEGPTNLIEAYFPQRILLDILAQAYPYAHDYGLNTMHQDAHQNVPGIEFIASDGVFRGGLEELLPLHKASRRVYLEGQEHLDPMFAAIDRKNYREDDVIRPFIRYVISHL